MESTPGYCSGVQPRSFSAAGMVMGSRPPGSASPKSTSATAWPCASPGRNGTKIAGTSSRHGISTAPGVITTTTVHGFAATIARTAAF